MDSSPTASDDVALANNRTEHHQLTVFQAAPLVWEDRDCNLHPVELLDFARERKALVDGLNDAGDASGERVGLVFETATADRFGAILARGSSSALHISCHGYPGHLCWEDGFGGLQLIAADKLAALVQASSGRKPKLVYVSSCHSRTVGEAFVKAGVPHVICCEQDDLLMDTVTIEFARAFYRALACGRTMREAYDLGMRSLELCPVTSRDFDGKCCQFALLPNDSNHDLPIFRGGGVRRGVESSVVNDVVSVPWIIPCPPNHTIGREVDMYTILRAFRRGRLVKLSGPRGIGKRTLAETVSRYIADRNLFGQVIWIPLVCSIKNCALSSSFEVLCDLLSSECNMKSRYYRHKYNAAISSIIGILHTQEVVLCIDAFGFNEGSMEKLSVFLRDLFRGTAYSKVLVVTQSPDCIIAGDICEETDITLSPLGLRASVLLFGMACKFTSATLPSNLSSPLDLAKKLVLEGQENLKFDSLDLSSKSYQVFHLVGKGFPAEIQTAATEITECDFDRLIHIAEMEECESRLFSTRAALEFHLQLLQQQIEGAVAAGDFSGARDLKSQLDEAEAMTRFLPSISDISGDMKRTRMSLEESIREQDFNSAESLDKKLKSLEAKLVREKETKAAL
eukprot:CAMPEP_0197437776 /NCGR_PEP_ID=MMETSP1175-20131217/4930_1 /TAXON_ID=1003142 /ORGANISM="Triceratium dubium, Strain CCMP147" /LENGTH=624 /DNA_ID=CAMNT_0042967377 /DNA_START=96 /DNA_END=1970 /DNA_ORIENTATION=+